MWRFIITAFSSLGFMGFLKLCISSWFNFAKLYISRNSFISFVSLVYYLLLKNELMIFWIFLAFVEIYHFSFWILVIGIPFVLLLANFNTEFLILFSMSLLVLFLQWVMSVFLWFIVVCIGFLFFYFINFCFEFNYFFCLFLVWFLLDFLSFQVYLWVTVRWCLQFLM